MNKIPGLLLLAMLHGGAQADAAASAPAASAASEAAHASAPAGPSWKIVDRIALGGEARWDLVQIDAAAHRLYVSHGTRTEVVDTQSGKRVGSLADTEGVHGIAIASALGRGFTSDGKADALTVFELATLKTLQVVKVGANPDVVVYDAGTRRVLSFNGRSRDVTFVDAEHGTVLGTTPVGGKPELAQVGRDGHVWFNVEDTAELVELDPATMKILGRHKLPGCVEPTGLAVDDRGRFYSGCGNRTMVVSAPDGAALGSAPIGSGVDGVAWQDGFAFSANGADGTISVVAEVAPGRFAAVAQIPTERGARTLVGDPATHRLYLPTADFAPAPDGGRPVGVPGTFRVLVVERQR